MNATNLITYHYWIIKTLQDNGQVVGPEFFDLFVIANGPKAAQAVRTNKSGLVNCREQLIQAGIVAIDWTDTGEVLYSLNPEYKIH